MEGQTTAADGTGLDLPDADKGGKLEEQMGISRRSGIDGTPELAAAGPLVNRLQRISPNAGGRACGYDLTP